MVIDYQSRTGSYVWDLGGTRKKIEQMFVPEDNGLPWTWLVEAMNVSKEINWEISVMSNGEAKGVDKT